MVVLLGLLFNLAPSTFADEASKKAGFCSLDLKAAGRTLRIMTVLGAMVLTGPRIVNNGVGLAAGVPHQGSSIFLDMENIEPLLSAAEFNLLSDVQKNKRAIIEMFSEKISGDYDNEYLEANTHLPSARFASTYFKGHAEKRGICRDKALVLKAVLGYYGIYAEIRTASGGVPNENGMILQTRGHQFLFIPELDSYIDPTDKEPFHFKLVGRKDFEANLKLLGFLLDEPSPANSAIQYLRESIQR